MSSTSRTWASSRSRGCTRRAASGGALERRLEARGRRRAVHAADERARRHRRRPDRLPHRRVAVPPDRQRLEPRRRLPLAEGARDSAAPTCATSPTSTRCSQCRARARSSGSASPDAKPFTWEMGEVDGVEVMVNRTGYTGELGVELMCPAEDAPALWDAVVAPRREAVRPRRARHAAARGLLPAARQRHHAGHRRDLRRARLDVRARHGVHRRRGAAPHQGARGRSGSSSRS